MFFVFLYIIFMLIGKLYINTIHKKASYFYKKWIDFLHVSWYYMYEDRRASYSRYLYRLLGPLWISD